MDASSGRCLVVGLLAIAAIIVVAAIWRARRRDSFGPGGPYGLGLYDSPRYYPHYQSRGWTGWDADGRCMTTCRDDGCSQVCR